MSLIGDITNTLNNAPRGADNSLTLQSSTFTNPQAALFFKNALSDKALVIGHAQIKPDGDQSVTVIGPGSLMGFDNLTLHLTFQPDPDDASVVNTSLTGTFDPLTKKSLPLINWITLSGLVIELDMVSEFAIVSTGLSGNVNIGSKGAVLPIAVQRSGASQWSIKVADDAAPSSHVTLDDLVTLVGGEQLASFIPQPLVDVLDGITVTGLACQFDTEAKTVSYFSAGVAVTNGWDMTEKIGLMPGLRLSLIVLNPVGPLQKTIMGSLRATAKFGSVQIPVFVQGSAGASTLWTIGVFPDDKITLPGLSHILELAGGQDFVDSLPKGFSDIPDILLSRFFINFDPTAKTLNEISFAIGTAGSWEVIAGYLTIQNISIDMEILNVLDPPKRGLQGVLSAAFLIGKTSVQVSLQKPTPDAPWSLSGFLAAGSSINLTDIAVKLFSGSSKVPAGVPEIVFDDLSITVTPANSYLDFEAGSNTPWPLTDGFALNYFNLKFAHDGANKTNPFSGHIKTQIQIGKELLISLEADLNEAGSTGWVFQGSLGTKDKNINLGQIVQDIATAFKTDKPPDVPHFLAAWIVQKIDAEFHTDNKDFKFDISIANSDAPGLSLNFSVQLAHSDKSFTVTFSAKALYATAQRGMEIDLTIIEQINPQPPLKVMTLTGDYKTTGNPPTLSDLLEAISQHFHTDANLPGELHLDAEVDGFAVFIKTSDDDPTIGELAGAFKLTFEGSTIYVYLAYTNEVTSDAEFKNRILVDNKPAYVLGATLGGVIDLSKLPLVGGIPGVSDLAIDKLGFFYTNATFKNKDDKAYFQVPQVSESPTEKNPLAPSPAQATVSKNGFNLIALFGRKGADNNAPISPMGTMNIPVGTGTPPPSQPPAFSDKPAQPDSPIHWLDVNKTLGPVSLRQVGLNYSSGEASIGFSAGLSMGGFSLDVQGLAITFPLPLPSMPAGHTVGFDIQGLSIDFQKGGLTIGGAFLKVVDQGVTNYFGEVVVQVGSFGFNAIGGYAPAHDGTDAAFFIYARLEIPLGGPPFLFVTGLAFGFGVNYQLILPTIDTLPTYLLLHGAPAQGDANNALTGVIPQLKNHSVIEYRAGEYWIAAGIEFTSFEMISSFALITISFGVDFQIAFIGSCSIVLPKGDPAPLANLEVDLVASFTASTGLLAVAGVITPQSFIFGPFIKLSGGFAFYIWFSGPHKGDFVVSLGGYHPAYTKPAWYPTVPRIQITFNLGPFQALGSSYLALTPAMFMAGLNFNATFDANIVKVWFGAGIDFLIGWAPFQYLADAYVNVGASLNLGLFTISIHIGADLHIWGPAFGGTALIDLDIVSFTIHFGSDQAEPAPITWQNLEQNFLPKAKADAKKAERMLKTAGATAVGVSTADSDTTPNVTASVAKGLISKNAVSQDKETWDWIIDPDDFVIVTATTVPANSANWTTGVDKVTGKNKVECIPNDPKMYGQSHVDVSVLPYLELLPKPAPFSKSEVWNPVINVKPMKLTGVVSVHTITLTKREPGDKEGFSDYLTEVTIEPVLGKSNTALWGEPSAAGLRDANTPPLLAATLLGFNIIPLLRNPDSVNSVPLNELLFTGAEETTFGYTSAQPDKNFVVTSTVEPVTKDLNITVSGASKQNLPNSHNVLSSLIDQWVSGQRKAILDDLSRNGFDTYSSDDVKLDSMGKEVLPAWPMVEILGTPA